jgi:MFS transporter, UMF1 family
MSTPAARGATADADRKKAWFGWCMYDWANSAFATVILAALLPVYFVALVPDSGASLLGGKLVMPASALWGYSVSLSMLLVAIIAPYLGSVADRHGWNRRLLAIFCLLGATATCLLVFAGPGDYLLTAALFVVANIGFAGGNVFYNAFLPALAAPGEMDRLSARGFALGYIGGGLMLLLAFVLIQWYEVFGFADQGAATRLSFLLTGLWWALFALPTLLLVKDAPGVRSASSRVGGLRGYFAIFGQIRRYPDLLMFLIAFLFYNDGVQTIIVVSAIFAREELGLSQTTILAAFLLIQFVAMPGSLLFGRIAERWGAKRSVMLSLLIFTAITVYAYFMEHAWQFWALAIAVALVLGGSQAISRSLYASLIPAGKTAEFFSFYAISAKFASIFGPLIFALIAHLTGSARLSVLAISGFFIVGMALLTRVDMQRGRVAAAQGASA